MGSAKKEKAIATFMKINADWHREHRMPKNATIDQRVYWHVAHAKHCACRPLEGKILTEIKKRGIPYEQKTD